MTPSADDRSLDDLVVGCLERMETDGERAVEELLAAHPGRADALRARIATLRATGLLALTREQRTEREREFPERLGDFRLLRRIGEGGMGVVFLAEQISLGRTVALKLVRPETLYFGGARERFRREVEAAARLSHPGIVPVHTVGEEAGIPFFAMEHVAGVSLADVVARLQGSELAKLRANALREILRARGADGTSSSGDRRRFDGSWVEACLSIARDVALALQHAHERGVLHRDVKPSNVMLTASGRTLLLDFGLAALQGSERLTRSGAQLGSLAYMAPEQIDGRADAIGPATDVYALGVTLYELLTLRMPYRGASAEELVRRIVEADPEPLRRHNAAVTSDVETLVRTAIDPDPARRYASAEAFARDLANVLEKRPIEARRASSVVRVRRWAQRHPGGAATIVLGLVLLVGVPLLHAFQERAARIEIAAQRDLAEANLASALEAVDFLTQVGEDDLAAVPQAEEARRKLLEGALGFYLRFAEQRGGDLRFQAEIARAHERVGAILALLGRHAEARDAHRRAIDGFEAVLAADPAHDVRRSLASARLAYADGARMVGAHDDARAAAQRATDELVALASAAGEDDDARRATRSGLASARRKLADLLRFGGDLDGAARELTAAIEEMRDLRTSGGTAGARALALEGGALTRLAEVEMQRRDDAAAEAALERARGLYAEADERNGQDVLVREQRALNETKLAQLLVRRGEFERAAEHARSAIALHETLAADFPRTVRYHNQLAVTLTTLGALEAMRGELEPARVVLERAASLLEEQASRSPDVPTYRAQLANVRISLAGVRLDAGDFAGGLSICERALEDADRTLERDANDAAMREARTELWLARARALAGLARSDEAADALEQLESTDRPERCCQAAFVAATCLKTASSALAGDSVSQDAAQARHRRNGLAFLRRAVELGWKDRRTLELDPRLEPLRDAPQFQALLATMPK